MSMIVKLIKKVLSLVLYGSLFLLIALLYAPVGIIRACLGKPYFSNTSSSKNPPAAKRNKVKPETDSLAWIDSIEELDAFLND